MTEAELTKAERERRKKLSANTRKMILSAMDIEDQDETSLVTGYCGYYLQIVFISRKEFHLQFEFLDYIRELVEILFCHFNSLSFIYILYLVFLKIAIEM